MLPRLSASLCLLVFLLAGLVPAGSVAQDLDDTESVPFPYMPTATVGLINLAARISSDTLLDEPVAMLFMVVGFGAESEAVAAFEPMVEHYFEGQQAILDESARYDYSMVSVGRLGDDRAAFLSEGRDIFQGSSSKDVHVFVRVGSGILYTRAVALGGETMEFVAEYLDGFLSETTGDPATLMPSLSDLPIGWELASEEPQDILNELITQPTPTPTATPFPTVTPLPTVIPSPTPTSIDAPFEGVREDVGDLIGTPAVRATPTASPVISTDGVRGSVIIRLDAPSFIANAEGICSGTGRFAGLAEGGSVVLRDRAATTAPALSTSVLPAGHVDATGVCRWVVDLGPLPPGEEFYLYVGNLFTGPISATILANGAFWLVP